MGCEGVVHVGDAAFHGEIGNDLRRPDAADTPAVDLNVTDFAVVHQMPGHGHIVGRLATGKPDLGFHAGQRSIGFIGAAEKRFLEPEHPGSVEAGQTLFTIDPRPYQIAVDAAKARLARDQAQLRAAELDAARYRKLYSDKIASEQKVEEVQADAATLRATIQADRADLASAELALSFTDVKAPLAGVAGPLLVFPGNVVKENQADALTTIIALLFAVAGGTFFYGASGVLSDLRLFTPNGQALAAFVNLAAAQADVVEVLPQILLLTGIGVGCAAVGLVALRNKVLT